MQKIGVMGTHGCGKTTKVLEMAARLKAENRSKQVGILTEVVRSCPFPVNQGTSESAQRWIFHRQMLGEIERSVANDILICDRTVLDNLAYAQHAGLRDVVADYYRAAIEWMKTYDQVIWVRPCAVFKPDDDGFRDTDPDYQTAIDRILAVWIKAENLNPGEDE